MANSKEIQDGDRTLKSIDIDNARECYGFNYC